MNQLAQEVKRRNHPLASRVHAFQGILVKPLLFSLGALCALLTCAVATAQSSAVEIELYAPVPPSLDRQVQLLVSIRNAGTVEQVLPEGTTWASPRGQSLPVSQKNGQYLSIQATAITSGS